MDVRRLWYPQVKAADHVTENDLLKVESLLVD